MKQVIPFLLMFAMPVAAAPKFGGQNAEETPISDEPSGWPPGVGTVVTYAQDKAELDRYLELVRTSPDFAGTETNIKFYGVTYTVNRLGESLAGVAKMPLPKAAAAALALANGLEGKSKGELHIKVTVREYNDNGTIKEDTIYEIDAGAQMEISSGKSEADDKNHK